MKHPLKNNRQILHLIGPQHGTYRHSSQNRHPRDPVQSFSRFDCSGFLLRFPCQGYHRQFYFLVKFHCPRQTAFILILVSGLLAIGASSSVFFAWHFLWLNFFGLLICSSGTICFLKGKKLKSVNGQKDFSSLVLVFSLSGFILLFCGIRRAG